jgi:hypothetical protein
VRALPSFLLTVLALAACGGPPPPEPAIPTGPGALHTLVPPGSALVVRLRPEVLYGQPGPSTILRAVFADASLERFAIRTGVDLRQVQELWVALRPEGHVVLARGLRDAPLAVQEAGARMAPIEAEADAPWIRRVGFLGGRRVDLAALGPHTALWVEGTPQLAAWVLDAAGQPAGQRRHGLRGAADLLAVHAEAPLFAVAPLPLGLPPRSGIGQLFALEERMAVTLEGRPQAQVELAADFRGEFPDGASDNFQALASSIADSELGGALGARDALPSLVVETSRERVTLRARVDASVLATGLRTLFFAEMDELLDVDGAPPARGEDLLAPRRSDGP